MYLTAQLAGGFDRAVRERGEGCFSGGAVLVRAVAEHRVLGTVQGDAEHCAVSLARQKDEILVSCTCAHYGAVGPCEHIWAALLASEAEGFLSGSEDPGPLYLIEGGEPCSLPPQLRHSTNWRRQLAPLRQPDSLYPGIPLGIWSPERQIIYFIDGSTGTCELLILSRRRESPRQWSKARWQGIPYCDIPKLTDPLDREILSLLAPAPEQYEDWESYYSARPSTAPCWYHINEPRVAQVIPLVCSTGRAYLRFAPDGKELPAGRWDDQGPWQFWLEVRPSEVGRQYVVMGSLRRGEGRLELGAGPIFAAAGIAFTGEHVVELEEPADAQAITFFGRRVPLRVPLDDVDQLFEELGRLPRLPRLALPDGMRIEEAALPPRPRLGVRRLRLRAKRDWLSCRLSFDYGGAIVVNTAPGCAVFLPGERRFIMRDPAAEQFAVARLSELGFWRWTPASAEFAVNGGQFARIVRGLLEAGWQVEAEGKLYRRASQVRLKVTSGIDWFELDGVVEFDGATVPLPRLLAALRQGQTMIPLADGTLGLVPQEWLARYGILAKLGARQGECFRYGKSQVGLLNVLLAAIPDAGWDAAAARAREELGRFEGIAPSDPPPGFQGRLRPYQCDGLGWLHFLRRFGFGGCLADDMGLGKTIQVLALLEARREQRARIGEPRAPSLLVLPRSLVFNWKQEAARFTPKLRILDHAGPGRARVADFQGYDMVITTYGTLRRDAIYLKDTRFDYLVLDEAQAIKYAATESAKAVRLLRADHRLALSGTPVENHLGELWSLLDFLNPGLLGAASMFQRIAGCDLNPEIRRLLARGLRPFILRRTKEQVASDLPAKTQQVLWCQLEPLELKLYEELHQYYRCSLLRVIESEGIGRAKIRILEALLRLRQAACHVGLIDRSKVGMPGAKLNMLLSQLAEVTDEGHKALVFSQFTSFLAILRDRLDARGIAYEYLDGTTRDRSAAVERFQTDPGRRLFLISLRAGGFGLNLTSADYVFLLDPWWNPAVESQAVDRAHRIGQRRPVFVYRLIARGTVEEKVLDLQRRKRSLAESVFDAGSSLIRNLEREDLEVLLA